MSRAGAKGIQTQIKRITSAQKSTRAMEMVAASKMRPAQGRMQLGRPDAKPLRGLLGHLPNGNPEYKHSFMQQRDVKRVGFILVSSDRGLCGGLNINVFKTAIRNMKSWSDQGVQIDLCLIGAKAAAFFKSFGGNVVAARRDL